MDLPFKLFPYRVSRESFESCNTSDGVPIVDDFQDKVAVGSQHLKVGSNYFIGEKNNQNAMLPDFTNLKNNKSHPFPTYNDSHVVHVQLFLKRCMKAIGAK